MKNFVSLAQFNALNLKISLHKNNVLKIFKNFFTNFAFFSIYKHSIVIFGKVRTYLDKARNSKYRNSQNVLKVYIQSYKKENFKKKK